MVEYILSETLSMFIYALIPLLLHLLKYKDK